MNARELQNFKEGLLNDCRRLISSQSSGNGSDSTSKSGVPNDLEIELNRLIDRVAEHRLDFESLQQEGKGTKIELSGHASTLMSLSSKLKNIETLMSKYPDFTKFDVGIVQQRLTALENFAVAQSKNNAIQTPTTDTAEFKALQSRVDTIEIELNKVISTLTSLTHNIGGMTSNYVQLEDFNNLMNRIVALENSSLKLPNSQEKLKQLGIGAIFSSPTPVGMNE
jgi:predicted  nucleic acid-binding Zn-ribbon protein